MATPQFQVPPLTAEEEDELIHGRLSNDEKLLKRVAKRYHAFASQQRAYAKLYAQEPSGSLTNTIDGVDQLLPKKEELDEARDAFLLDLSVFELSIRKSVLVCEAEKRQVLEYEKERERIESEGVSLKQDINNLKIQLEYEQLRRKQKIEYDVKAEKINAYTSRTESELAIATIREEIASAKAERDALRLEMQDRKLEFNSIVESILSLRSRGLTQEDEKDTGAMAVSTGVSRPGTPTVEYAEGEEADVGGNSGEKTKSENSNGSLNPKAKPFRPTLGTPASSRPGTPLLTSNSLPSTLAHIDALRGRSTPTPTPLSRSGDDDIEMGEVAEDPPNPTPPKKRTAKQDLEEGEDSGSELTDLSDQ